MWWNTQGRSDGEGRIDVVFPPEVICGKLKGAKEVNKRTLEWRACIIDRTELEQTTDYYAPTPPITSQISQSINQSIFLFRMGVMRREKNITRDSPNQISQQGPYAYPPHVQPVLGV